MRKTLDIWIAIMHGLIPAAIAKKDRAKTTKYEDKNECEVQMFSFLKERNGKLGIPVK